VDLPRKACKALVLFLQAMLTVTSGDVYFTVWTNLNDRVNPAERAPPADCHEFIRSRTITHLDVMLLIQRSVQLSLPRAPEQPGDFRSVEQNTLFWLRCSSSSDLARWECRVGIYLSVLCVLVNRMHDGIDYSGLFECITDLLHCLNRCLQDPEDLETSIRSCYAALELVNNNLASTYSKQGKSNDAEVLRVEVLEEGAGP
jgi:hypothetical protein